MALILAFAPREGRPPESLKQERHVVPANGDIVAVKRFFSARIGSAWRSPFLGVNALNGPKLLQSNFNRVRLSGP